MAAVTIAGMTTPAPKARAYRGISIEQRRAQRRQQLLDAGTQVIGQQGFRGTTVRAVCQQAGLTERYFYESFANSEALLGAVYTQAIEQVSQTLAEALLSHPGADAEQRSRNALHAYFSYLAQHPEAARIMMVEILGVSAEVDALYQKVMEDFTALLDQLWGELYPAAGTLPAPRIQLSAGILGALVYIAARWLMNGYQDPLDQVVDAAHTIVQAVNQHLSH